MPGYNSQRRGTARTSQFFFFIFIIMYVPFSVFCVLFECKCVLYYCHRVSTQLQLKINNNNNNNGLLNSLHGLVCACVLVCVCVCVCGRNQRKITKHFWHFIRYSENNRVWELDLQQASDKEVWREQAYDMETICCLSVKWLHTNEIITKYIWIKFYVLPTQCIYMFCVDMRINSDYFPIQH
jgi:hypothetical protein